VQIDFFEGKALNRSKVMNIKWLKNRSDTEWRDTLEITETTKQCEGFSTNLSLKELEDLQWRILHGAIAVNTFVAMLNPNVSEN